MDPPIRARTGSSAPAGIYSTKETQNGEKLNAQDLARKNRKCGKCFHLPISLQESSAESQRAVVLIDVCKKLLCSVEIEVQEIMNTADMPLSANKSHTNMPNQYMLVGVWRVIHRGSRIGANSMSKFFI